VVIGIESKPYSLSSLNFKQNVVKEEVDTPEGDLIEIE